MGIENIENRSNTIPDAKYLRREGRAEHRWNHRDELDPFKGSRVTFPIQSEISATDDSTITEEGIAEVIAPGTGTIEFGPEATGTISPQP